MLGERQHVVFVFNLADRDTVGLNTVYSHIVNIDLANNGIGNTKAKCL